MVRPGVARGSDRGSHDGARDGRRRGHPDARHRGRDRRRSAVGRGRRAGRRRRRADGARAHPARLGGNRGARCTRVARRHVAAHRPRRRIRRQGIGRRFGHRAARRRAGARDVHVRHDRTAEGRRAQPWRGCRRSRRARRGMGMDGRRHARPRPSAVPRARSDPRCARSAPRRIAPRPHRPADAGCIRGGRWNALLRCPDRVVTDLCRAVGRTPS